MRPSGARLPATLVVVALLSASLAAGGAGATPADRTGAPTTTMRIALQPDGTARWTVTARFALDSPNETRAFDRLAAEFENGTTDALSVEPFRRAAALAAESTGRRMTVRAVDRTARRSNGTGRLVLSFVWTGFANRDGDRLVLGDVFTTPSGTWLPGLTDRQELIVAFPDGYAVRSSSRPIRNGTFHIDGPATFEPGQPSATLVRSDAVTTTTVARTTTTTTAPPPTSDTPSPPGDSGLDPLIGAGLLAVLVGALALLVVRRRRVPDDGGEPAGDAPGDGPPPDGADARAGDGEGDAPGAADDEDAGGAGAPEPLLSDEERVLRLLHDNDGRMKQADIVEATDWSNAKVSQLLSEMDERGQVEKLRIGRENLISLPGESPDGSE